MSVPSHSKDAQLPLAAGVKRSAPAPSLLPAIDFEPCSSSPVLPRPSKRRACYSPSKYPTPVPTSSTAPPPSSPPPRLPPARRPRIQRTQSIVSERSPLCSVPLVELDGNGEATLMGRSSNVSHYQLSSNSLVSRIHLRALYVPAVPPAKAKIQIDCLGWNGVKVHCRGQVFELGKGDSFNSEKEDIDIMLDVHDARVLVQWPSPEKRKTASIDSDSTWDDENSPTHPIAAVHYRSPNTSPLRQHQKMPSPISPSPAVQPPSSPPFLASDPTDLIQVYEDEQPDELPRFALDTAEATQSTLIPSQVFGNTTNASQSSSLSEPQDFSDQDEENDPIIHSFGPFGDNLLPRLASFTAGETPERPKRVSSESASTIDDETNPVVNHAINQLAYSRLSSTPLSTIMNNLPSDLKTDSPGSKENRKLSVKDLRKMLDATRCVGEVTREGKDAAGKPLESEYYYIPDADSDETRRDAVVEGLKKPGLRACRKQHKQYYWRKPKN